MSVWQTIGELELDLCIHTCRSYRLSPAQTVRFTIVPHSRAAACQYRSSTQDVQLAYLKPLQERGRVLIWRIFPVVPVSRTSCAERTLLPIAKVGL
ncbi:uncharacterized protein SCHCODRAFT_02287237, partial [Schizophyllum commune H4-8]|uniref:uncharacterized protein n=1 Tax=Schizophyllum commune (strain H4-8 / FGSC 9210) TaxID=578458 RepID=UPI00215EDE84